MRLLPSLEPLLLHRSGRAQVPHFSSATDHLSAASPASCRRSYHQQPPPPAPDLLRLVCDGSGGGITPVLADLPGATPLDALWPRISICVIALPGQLFFVAETIMEATLLWPAVLAVLLG